MRLRSASLLLASILVISMIPIESTTAVSINPSPVCISSNCTVSFSYTGDYYLWNAPATGTYTLEVWGAQGGNAGYGGSIYTYGGKGGYAKGNISLSNNQAIYIYVGGQGVGGASTSNSDVQSGGFNGGGFGYNGSTSTNRGSGGGGGTDIRTNGSTLSNRIIVAGGGAGGVYFTSYGTNYPGVGGGSSGTDGYTANYNASYSYSGKGGTQLAGGAGGSNGSNGTAGTLGNGGNAGYAYSYGESGGGGGYYGGGASGTGMGGGGGSGYVGGVTTTTLTAGNLTMPDPTSGSTTGRSGNGFAKITYTYAPDTTAPTFSSSSTFSAAENIATSSNAATIKVSESATVTISAGSDASLFNIITSDSVTAFIRFKTSPNFEAPADVGVNNVYEITLTATDAAANAGTQSITITVTDVVDTSSFNSLALGGSATYRQLVTITANVSVASRVTFRARNVIISGCKNKLTTGSSPNIVATCSWKPSMRGAVVITASAVPTGAGISTATATPVSVVVGNRVGAR